MNNDDIKYTDSESLRIRAEENLKGKRHRLNKPETEQDIQKMVHELQVHQIELEMQNEELQKANETTEAALKKYTLLYDLAPMGYFTLDADGNITDLNFTAADILLDRRFKLVGKNFKLFVSDETRPVFNSFFKRLYSNISKESCRVKLEYDGAPLCSAYIEGVVTGEEQHCLLSVINITHLEKENAD